MADPGLIVAAAAAAGTVLGTGVAAAGVIRQDRRLVRTAGLESLWRMIEYWDGAAMQRRRARAAAGLLATPRRFDGETEGVLNFFELLGYLLRTRVLTEDDAWTNFSQWALRWWFACEEDIRTTRQSDPTIYEDFGHLVRRMRRVEARRRRLAYEQTIPSREDWTGFLATETRVSAPVEAGRAGESR